MENHLTNNEFESLVALGMSPEDAADTLGGFDKLSEDDKSTYAAMKRFGRRYKDFKHWYKNAT